MSYKDMIIALDIDGTLAKDDAYPSEYTCLKIHELIEKGYEIVLVTGRGYISGTEVYKMCNLSNFCVLYNGGLVINPTTQEVLRSVPYPKDLVSDILNNNELMNYISDIMVEDFKTVYSMGNKKWRDNQVSGDLNKLLNGKDVYAINTWLENHDHQKEVERILNTFKNHRYRYWNHAGEIYSTEYTKKEGIEAILKYYNKTFDDLIFIGDSDNDIELLKVANISVAMKNANENVKKVAKEITTFTNLEDGAVKYLLHKLNEE